MATTPVAERIEGLVLVLILLILLIVAGFAGAASFTHVKTWTLDNSPTGTGEWFGRANAVISELVPTACALVIRRKRRANQPVHYPLGLLVAAVCLSLAAQLAVATPSPSGWLLSAVPALAFIALTKLVLSTTPARRQPSEPVVAQEIQDATPVVDEPETKAAVVPARINGSVLTAGVIR